MIQPLDGPAARQQNDRKQSLPSISQLSLHTVVDVTTEGRRLRIQEFDVVVSLQQLKTSRPLRDPPFPLYPRETGTSLLSGPSSPSTLLANRGSAVEPSSDDEYAKGLVPLVATSTAHVSTDTEPQ